MIKLTVNHFRAVLSSVSHFRAVLASIELGDFYRFFQRYDVAQVSDSGSIRGQNYCQFDYFSEDYVGYSATFE
jgi:hypothetical protein